jgi:cytochrome P450
LLRDPRVSSDVNHPGFPSSAPPTLIEPGQASTVGFIMMDDPEHARLRRMVAEPFTPKKVAAMRPAIQRIVDTLIDEMLAGPNPTDLVTAFALPVPSLVVCDLLGMPYADHEFFQVQTSSIVNVSATDEERGQALWAMVTYLNDFLATKLENPGDDLLSGLAEYIRSGEVSQLEAAQIALLLLLAGHETTASMIALGTLALLEHPRQLALLCDSANPGLAASAAEELLRYVTITQYGFPRLALADIEIGGQIIRAGEGIIIANDIGNRDPEVFSDPDTLDIQRARKSHLAFGFGPHQCLGQPLARLELEIVYGTLYKRIPTLKLAVSASELTFKSGASVYGVAELPVSW